MTPMIVLNLAIISIETADSGTDSAGDPVMTAAPESREPQGACLKAHGTK